EMRKIKAQMIRRHQRSRLLHMLSPHLTQSSMKQMGGCMISHGGLTNVSIHHRIHFVTHADRLLSNNLMRPPALNRRIASRYFSDDGVVVVRIKPSLITDLSTGVGIERCVIEDDFPRVARLEFLRALAVVNDS